jgi:hypothetical protein
VALSCVVVGLDVTLFDAVTEYPYKRRENLDMVLQLMRCGTNNPYMSRETHVALLMAASELEPPLAVQGELNNSF